MEESTSIINPLSQGIAESSIRDPLIHDDVIPLLKFVFQDDIVAINSNNLYFWNHATLLWEWGDRGALKKSIRHLIRPMIKDFEPQVHPMYRKQCQLLIHKLGLEGYLNSLAKMYITEITNRDFKTLLDSDLHNVPIANGFIINLITKNKRRRVQTDYFTKEVDLANI